MESSSFSSHIKRIGETLRRDAANQILDYRDRLSLVKDFYKDFFEKFIVQGFNYEKAYETACGFFGDDKVTFVAIDGTECSERLFDMVIFFGGAYAAKGEISFYKNKKPTVAYFRNLVKEGFSLSCCVPVYINVVPEIDPEKIDALRSLSDQEVVDNSKIANWIMTFSEYYLAYKLVTDPKENVKILLMDRMISGDQAYIVEDTSKMGSWEMNSSILGFKINGTPIDKNDLFIGRHRVFNPAAHLPPPRGAYMRHSLISTLQKENRKLSLNEISEILGLKDKKRRDKAGKYLASLSREGLVSVENGCYSLVSRYRDSWDRLRKLVETIGNQLFFEYEEEEGMPLKSSRITIEKDNVEHYLTTLDFAFLSLFCLYMLIEECWKRHVLLIGLTKDTSARGFKRHVIPVCSRAGLFNSNLNLKNFERVPNTDRMLLQSISMFNCNLITPPWSLIEYDTAFATMIPDWKRSPKNVLGARKNKIIMERLFLKSYIQLSQSTYDPKLRSNVLLMDRLAYPTYDLKEENVVHFLNYYGGVDEPVEAVFYRDKEIKNELQNLVMVTLDSMTSSSIPEVFGYNKPLFVADKVAKWNNCLVQDIIRAAKHLIVTNHKLRDFIFYMSTFRERRAEFERLRRE